MASFFPGQRPRRLPVFFMLDISLAMSGTFQVTMHEGLQVVKNELMQHPFAGQHVYAASLLFNEHVTEAGLVPLEMFHVPEWEAQGRCYLKPALLRLKDALTFDVIGPRPEHPGDYTPLVFLVLGDEPVDGRQETVKVMNMLTGDGQHRRPLIIALVTQPELAQQMQGIAGQALMLQEVAAAHLTTFFFWAARAIAKICEDSERGLSAVELPVLPYGITMPR